MCCGKPCIVSEWRDGKYVYICINCKAVVG